MLRLWLLRSRSKRVIVEIFVGSFFFYLLIFLWGLSFRDDLWWMVELIN
jgi:hypothetical protein